MGLGGFTLADRLGAKSSPCSVPGCSRTWISLSTGKGAKLGGRGAADPNDPASSMCDPCREAYAKTRDQERACDRPGCEGKWVWPVMRQMEAFATKRRPPQGLCAGCEEKLAGLSDKTIPCAVPGCNRSSVFSRKAQLVAGAPEVEPPLPTARCAQCEGVYGKLKDRPVRCGINGCDRKWTWSADEQIEAYAAGLPNDPPRRMCDPCKASFGAIADREVRCRTSGCKKTWTWTRSDQLDACVANKPPPKAPHRMCNDCIAIYKTLKDVERPCRRSGCKGVWLDKRGGQLARAVRGKTGDPYPQYCESCAKEIVELEDRTIPCKTPNCTGTWIWTKAAQLAAGVRPTFKDEAAGPPKQDAAGTPESAAPTEAARADATPEATSESGDASSVAPEVEQGEPPATATISAPKQQAARPGKNKRKKKRREVRPPERRCQTCVDFLKEKKTVEIPCGHCGTPIYWPPESQLQTHLGAWAAPTMCGACKRDATEAARAAEREALRHGGATAQIAPPEPPEPEAPSSETSTS